MKRRLLLLMFAIMAGCCALATIASKLVVGEVVAYPVFAVAAFTGGLLGARISRRRTVAEGAIAAVGCGLLTLIVNASDAELRLIADPQAQRLSWAVGVAITCLVAALVGGRLGERLSARPPGLLVQGWAFVAASLGIGFAAIPVLFVVDQQLGELAMAAIEIPLLIVIPVGGALLLGISTEHQVPMRTLFVGPLTLGTAGIPIVVASGGDVAAACTGMLAACAFLGVLGVIGLAVVPFVERRIGTLVLEPEIPSAHVIRDPVVRK